MKYNFINVANFKNGLSVPLFMVYDPVENKITYRAYVYGRDQRGQVGISKQFEHEHKSKVVAWRESRQHDQR